MLAAVELRQKAFASRPLARNCFDKRRIYGCHTTR